MQKKINSAWPHRIFLSYAKTIICIILLHFIFLRPLQCYSDIHFFRAAPLFEEPRLERPWLSSFDIWIGGGSTKKSFDKDKHNVALFDVNGLHNMQELGNGICKNFADPLDLLLIQLSLIPGRDNFATFSIEGHFRLIEGAFRYTQNFKRGIFFEFYLPVRSYKVSDIVFRDLSPTDAAFPNNKNPIWLAFQKNFTKILEKHGLSAEFPVKQTGIGDMGFLLGWTYSYQETTELDFIDITLQSGVIVPTAKRKDEDKLFSLPLGYNKHWAVPVRGIGSIGVYEWLTFGAAIEATFFVPKTQELRLKTSPDQSGIIKLDKGFAKVDRGTLWLADVFIKADHVIRGFSLGIGYTYAQERQSHVTPKNPLKFSYAIVNTDDAFDGFVQHTFHAYAEYDFTEPEWKYGPRIGLAYNHPVSGRNIFKTPLAQLGFGLEVVWDY